MDMVGLRPLCERTKYCSVKGRHGRVEIRACMEPWDPLIQPLSHAQLWPLELKALRKASPTGRLEIFPVLPVRLVSCQEPPAHESVREVDQAPGS